MNKIYEWIDRVWQWIAGKVFVRFEFDLPIEALKAQHQDGRVLFALTRGGLIEWLILSSWCKTQGLGAILIANRKRVLLFAKPLFFFQVLFRRKTYSEIFLNENEHGPRLVFCPATDRRKPFTPVPAEILLGDIIQNSFSTPSRSWQCFPIVIFWKKHARAESRSFSEYLFGLSSSPNLMGQVFYLIRKRRDSTVKALEPISLTQDRLATDATEPAMEGEKESSRLAKTLRRKILVQVNQEMRIVLGPRYLSPHSVKETLLRHPEIQKLITEIALKEGVDRRKVMSEAYHYLDEIVANYQFRFVEVMYVVLSWLFTRLFDGVEWKEDQLQQVRELMRTKPVVFVCCHRSHLDYLVIPYVLFVQNMVPPHVVAGVNLSFWPVGHFMRMGGAFFIRRSFRGNVLYSFVLKKYIELLLKNKHNIKFFIEGTRSRSGKMLPPAYGILKMVMEVYQQKVIDDLMLIPVSLCYDEILEQGSYSKELQGGKKTKENASSFLQSRKVIRKNIGKVYVRFAEALSVKEIFHNAEQLQQDPTLTLQKTAFELCRRINDVTPITPKAIVCAVFLTDRLASVTLEEILRLSQMLARYVEWSGAALSMPFEGDNFRRAVEQVVRKLHKSGVLSLTELVPRTFYCDNRRRLMLNFYKNNAIHRFVLPSITLIAVFQLVRSGKKPVANGKFFDLVLEEAYVLRNLLKFDFFFNPTAAFAKEVERNFVYFFGEEGLSKENVSELIPLLATHLSEWDDVAVFLRMLGDLLESYQTALSFVQSHAGDEFEKKNFSQKLLRFGQDLSSRGGISFSESVSVQSYSNAALLLENLGFVSFSEDKSRLKISSDVSGVEAQIKKLSEYLDLMRENPEAFIHPESRWMLDSARGIETRLEPT